MNQKRLMRAAGLGLLLLGVASAAFAQVASPEIDASSGISALTLLSGALLVIKGRR